MTNRAVNMFVVALLFVASPGAAQSRSYTNADLGKPIVWAQAPSLSAETLQGLRDRQPVVRLDRQGPTSLVLKSDPTAGPFGPFAGPPLPSERERRQYNGGIPFFYPYGPILAPPGLMLTPLGARRAPNRAHHRHRRTR